VKDDKKRRNAVARILGAENKTKAVEAEAKRAGVSPRTVERWVEAAKASPTVGQTVGQPVVSENVAPPEKPAENPVLDTLLQEEGQAGKPLPGKPTAVEIAAAGVDAENFCVDAYSGIRSAVGSVLVSMRYTPPLDATSPEVLVLLRVSKPAELAIRANAPRLYPILVKYASNWGALFLAVAADALGLLMGLEGTAKAKGWTPPPKKGGDQARTQVPTEKQYGEQLKPKPSPAPSHDPKPAEATIVDAPLPEMAST
jgi:hypothetical protein